MARGRGKITPGFGLAPGTTIPWCAASGVPHALIELRVESGRKLGGYATAGHRLEFGRELLLAMAEGV